MYTTSLVSITFTSELTEYDRYLYVNVQAYSDQFAKPEFHGF